MEKITRPKVLGGITVRAPTGCGSMYIQLNWYHGRLFEIFATLGKSGGCSMTSIEALTRSITAGLRRETPVPVEEYVDQLQGVRCPSPYIGPPGEGSLSCPDAIATILKAYGMKTFEEIIDLVEEKGDSNQEDDDNEEYRALTKIERLREERDKLDPPQVISS